MNERERFCLLKYLWWRRLGTAQMENQKN